MRSAHSPRRAPRRPRRTRSSRSARTGAREDERRKDEVIVDPEAEARPEADVVRRTISADSRISRIAREGTRQRDHGMVLPTSSAAAGDCAWPRRRRRRSRRARWRASPRGRRAACFGIRVEEDLAHRPPPSPEDGCRGRSPSEPWNSSRSSPACPPGLAEMSRMGAWSKRVRAATSAICERTTIRTNVKTTRRTRGKDQGGGATQCRSTRGMST